MGWNIFIVVYSDLSRVLLLDRFSKPAAPRVRWNRCIILMFSRDLKQHPGSGPATKASAVFGAPGSRGVKKFPDIGYRNDACGLFEGSWGQVQWKGKYIGQRSLYYVELKFKHIDRFKSFSSFHYIESVWNKTNRLPRLPKKQEK